MSAEYLFFNVLVALGPLAMSFESRIRYVNAWGRVFTAIVPVAAVFLVWDILVAGRHWWFHPHLTSDVYILGLPLGEWLFFFTVPFACLFVWENLHEFYPYNRDIALLATLQKVALVAFPIAGIAALIFGYEYTGIVSFATVLPIVLERVLKVKVLTTQRAMQFMSLVVLLIFFFNLYLTARPIVYYGDGYFLGLRLVTIPIEDFFYGISLLNSVLVIYEFLRRRDREQRRQARQRGSHE